MRFHPALKRVLAVLALAVVASFGTVAVTAGPASAGTGCTWESPESAPIYGNAVYASAIVSCAPDQVGVFGWLSDTACDSRSVYVRVRTYHISWLSESLVWERSTGYGGGCNNGKSYSFSGDGSNRGRVNVCIWAGEYWPRKTTEVCFDFSIG
jgi:hypothetical protein